jgi:hypothetical protein
LIKKFTGLKNVKNALVAGGWWHEIIWAQARCLWVDSESLLAPGKPYPPVHAMAPKNMSRFIFSMSEVCCACARVFPIEIESHM